MYVCLQYWLVCSNRSSPSSALSSGHVIPASNWTELPSKLSQVNVPEGQSNLQLEDVLSADTLNTILEDSDIRAALFPFVSESSHRSDAEIEQLVQSQQFQQRLQLLNAALQQDALTTLVDALETEKGKCVWTSRKKKVKLLLTLFYWND